MVVIAVLAILATIAAPSFRSMTERWRVDVAKEAFAASLYLARREAIKNVGRIIMARRPAGDSCVHASEAKNWGCGWDICVDADGNGRCDAIGPSPSGGGDVLLQSVDPPKSVNVVLSANSSTLTFSPWGHPNGLGTVGVTFSPHPGGTAAAATITLCMSAGGRIRYVRAAKCS